MADDFPPGWTKTVADLVAEARKFGGSVGPPETNWAIAYSRSLLRPGTRFPFDGDIYEAIADVSVHYL